MLIQPKKTKFRKQIKSKIPKFNLKSKLNFGSFGIQSLRSTRLKSSQIEACRRVLTRHLKKTAKIWTRVFPNVPIRIKPKETRIGKGKGNVDHWVVRVRPGTVLFEIQEINTINSQLKLKPLEAKLAFQEVAKKLPCSTRFISL